jgi:hypothetical protein
MTVQALVRHTFGTQGHEETFSEPVENDFMIKYFEKETNRANDTSNSIVLYIKKVIQNEDGSIKINSEGDKILESIYINAAYAKELSRG